MLPQVRQRLQIITNEPEYIKVRRSLSPYTSPLTYLKTILTTDFNSYEKGPLLYEQLNTLLGAGVFNSDGALASSLCGVHVF